MSIASKLPAEKRQEFDLLEREIEKLLLRKDEKIRALEESHDSLKADVEDEEKAHEATKNDLKATNKHLESAKKNLGTAKKDAESAKPDLEKANEQLTKLQVEIEELEAHIKSSDEESLKKDEEIAALKKDLESMKEELSKEKTEVAELTEALKDSPIPSELDELRQSYRTQTKELDECLEDLQAKKNELEKCRAELPSDVESNMEVNIPSCALVPTDSGDAMDDVVPTSPTGTDVANAATQNDNSSADILWLKNEVSRLEGIIRFLLAYLQDPLELVQGIQQREQMVQQREQQSAQVDEQHEQPLKQLRQEFEQVEQHYQQRETDCQQREQAPYQGPADSAEVFNAAMNDNSIQQNGDPGTMEAPPQFDFNTFSLGSIDAGATSSPTTWGDDPAFLPQTGSGIDFSPQGNAGDMNAGVAAGFTQQAVDAGTAGVTQPSTQFMGICDNDESTTQMNSIMQAACASPNDEASNAEALNPFALDPALSEILQPDLQMEANVTAALGGDAVGLQSAPVDPTVSENARVVAEPSKASLLRSSKANSAKVPQFTGMDVDAGTNSTSGPTFGDALKNMNFSSSLAFSEKRSTGPPSNGRFGKKSTGALRGMPHTRPVQPAPAPAPAPRAEVAAPPTAPPTSTAALPAPTNVCASTWPTIKIPGLVHSGPEKTTKEPSATSTPSSTYPGYYGPPPE